MSCEACKQSEPQWPLLPVMSSRPMHTLSKRVHSHTHFISLLLSHTHSQRCRTCHPCNHQQVSADTKGGMRRLVLSGVTVGGSGGKRRKRKMRVIMLKLVLSEKVTDDLMLAVTSPCRRNQVVWQRPISSPPSSSSLPHFHVFFFLLFWSLISCSICPNFSLCWTSSWPT